MRLLLDTQIVIWAATGARKPTEAAREAIRSADAIFVSSLSYAEIGIKASIGKLEVPRGLEETMRTYGARTLPLSPRHGLRVAELPLIHRDPFDRLLIAQAAEETLTILSSDTRFPEYEVSVISAQ